MSFVVTLALAIGLLIAVPIAAHLLRRGRADERDFPPAMLVPAAPPVARQRNKLEDRALLAVRGLMVLALAVLGATPLVKCSRLNLSRQSGASVALAIVVDDSLSMRAEVGDKSRFERARDAALDLCGSAREGDAIAIVLAGAPARLALAATTDIAAARRALSELGVGDRSTDLVAAVQIARSSLKQLPHVDKRVVLLSDLAGEPVPEGEPEAWAPVAELRTPVDNCGIASAERSGKNVTATIGCTTAAASRGRELEVHSGGEQTEVVARGRLAVRSGVQTVSVELASELVVLDVALSGKDALEHDDRAPVAPRSGGLVIAAVTDATTGSVTTGGATVLEQALDALAADAVVRPYSLPPEDPKELASIAALMLDDPAGLTPEARLALSEWLDRGGVALALLGPRVDAAKKLGATLEPFVRGEVTWRTTEAKGVSAESATWLGEPGASLSTLSPTGRVELDTAAEARSRVILKWDDGRAFAFETPVGRGLALTTGLPASVEVSDFALRPGFLALLDHVVAQAARRSGPPRSRAGAAWMFAQASDVKVETDGRALDVTEQKSGEGDAAAQKITTPELRGRYRVVVDGVESERIVTIDADEIARRARDASTAGAVSTAEGGDSRVDASEQLALVLLALFAFELGLRALGRQRRRRRQARVRADDLPRAA